MSRNAFEDGPVQQSQHARQQSNIEGLTSSLPNSQESSLNDSLDSQSSQPQPHMTAVLPESRHGIVTPSTSLSNKSSQEGVGAVTFEVPVAYMSDHVPARQAEQHTGNVPTSSHTSAPKRMANGHIKPVASSVPTSPGFPSHHGHSRNSSTTSRSSNIGELSSQLQTRLSYAKVKVQNGWQSYSISELENMASKQGSPRSVGSDQQRPHASPASRDPSLGYPGMMRSPSGASAMPRYSNTSSPETTLLNSHYRPDQQLEQSHAISMNQVGASYESFWRDHEMNNGPRNPQTQNPSVAGPSLAPPLDILPRTSRRPDGTSRQPPPLRTADIYNTGAPPSTPPPKTASKMRTPSQQAAVEKDAVESLIFMSSPGNSGYHPPAALSGTPLRAEFSTHAIQTPHSYPAPRGVADLQGAQSGRAVLPAKEALQSRKPLSNADIDKLLDEMSDSSDTDDEDLRDGRHVRNALVR